MQVINTNVSSLNAQRQLAQSGNNLNTTLARLSSGLRINSAKDDAAGLAISERMTAQVRGLDQARRNANDGVSYMQTAEGALGQMGNILQRVRELAVQSTNATNSAADRQTLNEEVSQLVQELDRFAVQTEFNGRAILDGSNASMAFQVGANAQQTITASSANFRTTAYGSHQIGNSAGSATNSAGVTGSTGMVVSTTGELTVRGTTGSGVTTGVTVSSSARDVANAINNVDRLRNTGVKASAYTETTLTLGASGSYTFAVTGTNTTAASVTFSASATNTAAGLTDAVTAFNAQSSKTGVTAKLNDAQTGLVLMAADGSNITLATTAGVNAATAAIGGAGTSGTMAASAAGTATAGGQLILDSEKSFSIVGAVADNLHANTLGTALGSAAAQGSTLRSVQALDVTNFTNATQAIRIVDGALNAVNSQRGNFGALQNRFDSTIANLQTSSMNLSSARSRIRDADFASETANLTRSQILQQAGTAMLAQANSLPNNVLSLLRG
jgi:flagellin